MAKVTFRFEEGEPVVTYATEGERLLEVAQKSNVPIDAPCSGNASCGKCRVRLVSGDPAIFLRKNIRMAGDWRASAPSKAMLKWKCRTLHPLTGAA